MLVKLIDGRVKDVPLTEVTKENYIVPEKQKKLYHCIIEVRKFNQETGERLSRPRLQKFGIKAFEGVVYDNLRKQGYTIEIVHNPHEYLAEQIAKDQEKKAEAEKAMLEEAERLKQVEIDKAVAKALAKQKAEYEKKLAEAGISTDENEEKATTKRGRSAKTE